MRKGVLCILGLLLLLAACGKPAESGPTWQEQYDLGVRYLSEGKYQEAILAFTAAIEIDPKRAEAYVERGGAYVQLGGTEENLSAAQADFEKAMELDSSGAAAYLGLAEVYLQRGDTEKAMEILRQGLEQAGENQDLAELLSRLEGGGDSGDGVEASFASQFYYRPFEEYSAQEQGLIQQAVNAAVNGDRDSLARVVDQGADLFQEAPDGNRWDAATVWNGYKVTLNLTEREVNGNHEKFATVEIHPENGTGYHFRTNDNQMIAPPEDSTGWFETYHLEELITCPCVNWQWEGELTRVMSSTGRHFNRYFGAQGEGKYSDIVAREEETGTMRGGLRDGAFTTSEKFTSLTLSGEEEYTDTTATEKVYQNGVQISENGQPVENRGYSDMQGMSGYDDPAWIVNVWR